MKSSLCSDEICFADEIKSVLLPTKLDFVTKWFHSTIVGFIPSARTDLVEKKHLLSDRQKVLLFWCRWPGSNRYGIATTGFWVQHVCQFHHTGKYYWLIILYVPRKININFNKKSNTTKRKKHLYFYKCFVVTRTRIVKQAWRFASQISYFMSLSALPLANRLKMDDYEFDSL